MKCNALLARFWAKKDEQAPDAIMEIRCRRCRGMNEMQLPGAKQTCLIG